MRVLILILILFPKSSLADEKPASNWKTFQSDFGYEFKYPDCWGMSTFESDEVGPLSKMKNIHIEEKIDCLYPEKKVDHKGAFTFEFQGFRNKLEKESEINKIEEDSKFNIKTKDWILAKKSTIGHVETSFIYIEHWNKKNKYLRWKAYIQCSNITVLATGPMIFNPDEHLMLSIKSGKNSMPEPENSIYESIRCIEPKIKPKITINKKAKTGNNQ